MFAGLGGFARARRWWVIGAWAVVMLAGIVFSGPLFGRLQTVDSLSSSAESKKADVTIERLTDAGPFVFAVVDGVDVYEPRLVEQVSKVSGALKDIPNVVDVDDLYTSPGGRIGSDNRSTLVRVELAEGLSEDALDQTEDAVRAKLETITAPILLIGGDHVTERAFGDQAVSDLAVGETVAFAALIVALLIIFSGAIGASIPIVVAIVGVTSTFLVLLAVSAVTEVGEYSLNIVSLLGLGLAVDYALLIVARFREERAAGAEIEDAIDTAVARAGRAVAISGLAVAVALAGLTAFAEPLLASMAIGGTAVALLTTALAITLVPALLAVMGKRIPPAGAETWVTRLLRRKPNPEGQGLLVRLASIAQRHSVPVALAATLGLFALAAPLASAAFGNSDARSLPASNPAREAYEAYQRLFNRDQAAPVTIVATVDASTSELRDYLNVLNRMDGVTQLNLRPDVPAGYVIIDLNPRGVTGGAESKALVERVRDQRPGFQIQVTGPAAALIDYQQSVSSRLPGIVIAVIVAMLILLFILTRSIIVPIKAVILNALTYLATLGVLVAVFVWGWGEPILRFDSWGALDVTTPLLLFVFIFGLSMDYEVFLLARIREAYEERPDNDRAVLTGIAKSGRVVTAAAVCITLVFLGFAAGGLVAVKEIGVGMAVAVILDVTVVRGLLLPAVMTMLGELNWWSPMRKATVGK